MHKNTKHYFYDLLKAFMVLFIASAFVLGCGDKVLNEKDFSKLSNDEKIQLLDTKIKKDPKNAELYYQRAEVFYGMDNTQEAMLNISNAIKYDSKKVKYYLLEADIFFSRGETTLAFNSLEKATKIDKKSVEAQLKIAELSLDLKDYKRSLQSVNKVLEIDKINSKAYFIRGWVLKETGDTNGAVQNYRKAIELKSDYEQPYEELGILYAEKNDGLAVDYLKSTIKINPKNTQAMYALALFYQNNSAVQQALDMYKQILKIKPDHADAIHNVGWINYTYKKDYTTALDCFNKAIRVDSTFYQAYYNRGKTLEKLGRKDEAKKDFAKANELKNM